MRRKRFALGSALILVTVLVAGGVGFAAFTSTATISGASGNAGTLTIVFTYVALNVSTPSYIQLTNLTGIGTSYVTLDVGPVGPGDTVTFNFTAKNVGSVDVVSPTLSYTTPGVTNTCDGTFYSGSVNVPGEPLSLAAGAAFSGTFSIVESGSVPPSCMGTNATFSFTVSGDS